MAGGISSHYDGGAFNKVNCGPRGGTGGAKPGSGVKRFWGPLGASEIDLSLQPFGVSETPSQGPLGAAERLSGLRGDALGSQGRLFRGLGEVCPFSKEQGKKVGHSEAPKRPRFPGCLLRGFQPSGSHPQDTDNKATQLIIDRFEDRLSDRHLICLNKLS